MEEMAVDFNNDCNDSALRSYEFCDIEFLKNRIIQFKQLAAASIQAPLRLLGQIFFLHLV